MSELQPGMLALVIGCRVDPSNIGKVVSLVKFMHPGDIHDGEMFAGPEAGWKISSDNLVFLIAAGDRYFSDTSYARGSDLLPLPPLSDPLDQKQQQELHG